MNMTGIKVSWNYSDVTIPGAKYRNDNFIKIANIVHSANSTANIWGKIRKSKRNHFIKKTFADCSTVFCDDAIRDFNVSETIQQLVKMYNVSNITLQRDVSEMTLETAFDMFVYLSSDQTVEWTSWVRAFKKILLFSSLQNILMKISNIKTSQTTKQLLQETMSDDLDMAFVPLERLSYSWILNFILLLD